MMTSKKLRVLAALARYGVVVALLLILAALIVIQTAWFREKVHQRIVAAVEQATGGRVEVAGFSYDWHTLTAAFQGFVVHGSEDSSALPLFRAASVKVQVRIVSVIERRVAVSSIIVEHPQINILVRSDGSTNVLGPDLRSISPEKTVQDLLNFRLRHFE